ncbi:hypothetical protein BCR44DRAFT_62026 [Catenaria anguillulae PL171]|uniref:Uncharacterized protein n=1 Tax=Catenaria anguillulae PL171 TaxID=765915 RepID=A0A1Y2HJY1_9FUNG|nr:hypothetical protein BCR44DRAFT_62026 [Catenaria anguillulae PL171]
MSPVLAIQGAFNIKFSCSSDRTFCGKAEKAFQRAAARIASEFKIKNTINVDLSMFLPCGTDQPADDCAEINTLGFALPTQRLRVRHKDDNQVYLYATSLLKQLDFPQVDRDQIKWPKYDILARFNALRNWWFSDDGTSMKADQRDLEQVATHELLHGLGYGDDTLMSFQVSTRERMLAPYYDSSPPSVQPPPESTDDSDPIFNGDKLYRFTEPSIWNRFTFLGDRPVSAYVQAINAAFDSAVKAGRLTPLPPGQSGRPNPTDAQRAQRDGDRAYSPDAVFAELRKDEAARSAMTTLYTLGTRTGALEFRPTVWPPQTRVVSTTKMVLESGLSPYVEGSSLAHVAQQANRTQEFLMVFRAVGLSFSNAIQQFQAPNSGIGKGTKDVLVAMGFTPAGNVEIKRSFTQNAEILPEGLAVQDKDAKPAGNRNANGGSNGSSSSGSSSAGHGRMGTSSSVAVLVAAVLCLVIGV